MQIVAQALETIYIDRIERRYYESGYRLHGHIVVGGKPEPHIFCATKAILNGVLICNKINGREIDQWIFETLCYPHASKAIFDLVEKFGTTQAFISECFIVEPDGEENSVPVVYIVKA